MLIKDIYNKARKERKRIVNIICRKKISNQVTIFSSNCVGGVIYHNANSPFFSPTINMFFYPKDFLKFCKEPLKYTSEKTLLLLNKEETILRGYPVVIIEDIMAYGVHYKTFEEFVVKWRKRCKLINMNKICVIMTERDGCTYEDLLEFDSLPYSCKVVFTHKTYNTIKSSYYIPGSEIEGNDFHKVNPLTSFTSYFSFYRWIDKFNYLEFINYNLK